MDQGKTGGRRSMRCPQCGMTFSSDVVNLAFIPIMECPKCGPVADLMAMTGNIQNLIGDEVTVTLSGGSVAQLARALRIMCDEFKEPPMSEVLAHVNQHVRDGKFSFTMPRTLALMAQMLVKAEVPGVVVTIEPETEART